MRDQKKCSCLRISGGSRLELADGSLALVASMQARAQPTRLRGATVMAVTRKPGNHAIVVRVQVGKRLARVAGVAQTVVHKLWQDSFVPVRLSALKRGDYILVRGNRTGRVVAVQRVPARYQYELLVSPYGAAALVAGTVFVW